MSEESLSRIENLIIALSDKVDQKFKVYDFRFDNIEIRLKTIELDVEPDGRISEAFKYLSDEIDSFKEETNKRLDRLEHGQSCFMLNSHRLKPGAIRTKPAFAGSNI